jgi:DNA-binding LacI/PurR family transcriptional regulator
MLVSEGLLLRRQGSGTFIVPRTRYERVHLHVASGIKKDDPYYSRFLDSLFRHLGPIGVTLRQTESSSVRPQEHDEPLIILGMEDHENLEELRSSFRYVVAAQAYPAVPNLTQVCFDDYQIGYRAGLLLQQYGHRRVVHLAGPSSFPSSAERERAFRASYGDSEDAIVLRGKMNWRSGYELGDQLLNLLGNDDAPTAVFAANDWMAIGAIHRLREYGKDVPGTLSFVGCDNIDMSTQLTPALSTFELDLDYLVTELFDTLNELIEDEAEPGKRVMLPAELVLRESLKGT